MTSYLSYMAAEINGRCMKPQTLTCFYFNLLFLYWCYWLVYIVNSSRNLVFFAWKNNLKPLGHCNKVPFMQNDRKLYQFIASNGVVSHLLLLDKLQLLGFDLIVISWFKSFLTGCTMSVSVSGTSSLSMPITFGVPQGSVLGPIIFLIYVNFITVAVAGCWIAFADDFDPMGENNC